MTREQSTSATRRKPIGILGGTFDPVHYGHLRIGQEVYQDLELDHVRFIPCWMPPHKERTHAKADMRRDLLAAALQGNSAFVLDEREFDRKGSSYTVDTLQKLKEEFGDRSLCLIIGSDSFLQLDTWHEWQSLIDYCHIVVAVRPGWQGNPEQIFDGFFAKKLVRDADRLHQTESGHLLVWQVSQLEISATRIRGMIAQGKSPRYLLPAEVMELIEQNALYRG